MILCGIVDAPSRCRQQEYAPGTRGVAVTTRTEEPATLRWTSDSMPTETVALSVVMRSADGNVLAASGAWGGSVEGPIRCAASVGTLLGGGESGRGLVGGGLWASISAGARWIVVGL